MLRLSPSAASSPSTDVTGVTFAPPVRDGIGKCTGHKHLAHYTATLCDRRTHTLMRPGLQARNRSPRLPSDFFCSCPPKGVEGRDTAQGHGSKDHTPELMADNTAHDDRDEGHVLEVRNVPLRLPLQLDGPIAWAALSSKVPRGAEVGMR
jgi:hypothetical protein